MRHYHSTLADFALNVCFVQRLRAVFTQIHACDEKLDFQMFHDVIYHRKYTRLSTIYTFNTILIDLQKKFS